MTPCVSAFLLEDDGRALDCAIAELSAADQARAASIGAAGRRREFVLGRMLARHALRTCLGGDWSLLAESGRRPVAHSGDGRVHPAFNLSHSRGVIACAVGPFPNQHLGCDLEARRPRAAVGWRRIADRTRAHPMFGAAERAWLCAGTAADRDDRLISLWTVKEALGKADGRGIHRGALHARAVDIDALSAALRAADGVVSTFDVDSTWQASIVRLAAHWLSIVTSRGARTSIVALEQVRPSALLR